MGPGLRITAMRIFDFNRHIHRSVRALVLDLYFSSWQDNFDRLEKIISRSPTLENHTYCFNHVDKIKIRHDKCKAKKERNKNVSFNKYCFVA